MVRIVSVAGGAPRAGGSVDRHAVRFGYFTCCLSAWLLVAGLVGSTALAAVGPAGVADGSVFCNGIRAQDEIILVSTRSVCTSCDPATLASALRVQTYQPSDETGRRRWQPSDLETLVAADPTVPTVVFVHGNQIASGQDQREGLRIYRRLVRHGGESGPMRFVVFSWPSAKIRGPLKDFRVKAARTRPVGCQLAWLLNQLPAETPLTLIGYSYGARVITGGLHVLGGGSLGGLDLAEPAHPDRRPVRVVLIAAALHANWLGPNQYHGQAMSQVEQMVLLNNRQDVAMRYYHFSSSRGRPQALGLRGPTCIAPEDAAKITKRDLSCYDGRRHDLFRYLSAPGVQGQIWQLAMEY